MSNIVEYIENPEIQTKFAMILGEEEKRDFLISLTELTQSDSYLSKCSPATVVNAAAMAAVLKLPIVKTLGLAYIVPYKGQAQFQIGYRGLIQLAIRSGFYKTINTTEIYQSQVVEFNPLHGHIFDFSKKREGKVVGYAGFYQLKNGFEKTLFLDISAVKNHARKFSKTINSQSSPWNTDFDAMALKTVLKMLIDKWGPKSLEMQKAISSDQAIINDFEGKSLSYDDNPRSNQTEDLSEKYQDIEIVDFDSEDGDLPL